MRAEIQEETLRAMFETSASSAAKTMLSAVSQPPWGYSDARK